MLLLFMKAANSVRKNGGASYNKDIQKPLYGIVLDIPAISRYDPVSTTIIMMVLNIIRSIVMAASTLRHAGLSLITGWSLWTFTSVCIEFPLMVYSPPIQESMETTFVISKYPSS